MAEAAAPAVVGRRTRTVAEHLRATVKLAVGVVLISGFFLGVLNGIALGIRSRFAAGTPTLSWGVCVLGVLVMGCVAGGVYGYLLRPKVEFERDFAGSEPRTVGGGLWIGADLTVPDDTGRATHPRSGVR